MSAVWLFSSTLARYLHVKCNFGKITKEGLVRTQHIICIRPHLYDLDVGWLPPSTVYISRLISIRLTSNACLGFSLPCTTPTMRLGRPGGFFGPKSQTADIELISHFVEYFSKTPDQPNVSSLAFCHIHDRFLVSCTPMYYTLSYTGRSPLDPKRYPLYAHTYIIWM